MSRARGSSFDALSVSDLCAPISATRMPEFLRAEECGSSMVDPRSESARNARAAKMFRGDTGNKMRARKLMHEAQS